MESWCRNLRWCCPFQFFWPDRPSLNRLRYLCFLVFSWLRSSCSQTPFGGKNRNPTLHLLITFVLVGWGILLLLVPFTGYRSILILIVPYGVLTFLIAGAGGLVSMEARTDLPDTSCFHGSDFHRRDHLILLVRLEVMPSKPFTEQFFRLGIIWLMAFWSVALADRINLLKAEKEKANLEVQASEARYRQLVETMNDGLGVIDEDGRFTYANDRLAEMLGYPADEIIGQYSERIRG